MLFGLVVFEQNPQSEMNIYQWSFSDVNDETPHVFLNFFSEVVISDKLLQYDEDLSNGNVVNFLVNSADVF